MAYVGIIFWWLFATDPTRAADSNEPIDFKTQIVPVLTRSGCNAGSCHGAAAGRGGFHLSLLGADPAADHEAIVQALEGRRVNLARPELSLLLTKPTGILPHGGGLVLDPDGNGAKLIESWILAGASPGAGRQLTELEVTPRRHYCETIPATVPIRIKARFDQGEFIDVTEWAVFTSADPGAVTINPQTAVAEVRRRGQHVIIARFLNRVSPIQIIVPLNDSEIDLSHESRENLIDDEILRTLSVLRLPVSPEASETAYLRRVRLDLTGRLPSTDEIAAYLADSSNDKRTRLVDRLLASPEFTDYWTLFFARLLRMHSLPHEMEGVTAYSSWLRDAIDQGTPLDAMARELITATGDSHQVGAANFGRMVGDARGHAELVGQFFLGTRLGCANCHDHPLDRWTQDDYHGLAAIFARLERGRQVELSARGAVTNLRTGEPALPRIPGERYLSPEGDHRAEFANWATSSEHKYFAKVTVNRLWRAMFGRGFVEPTDDLRDTNPPTHPELLERLAKDFADHRYDLRQTLRLMALSQTYARSSTSLNNNAVDDRFYSHAYRRPLSPEVLADAIDDVTGVASDYANQPPGTRAICLIDPLIPAPALDILGRCSRIGGCEAPDNPRGLATQLHLLNGDLINQKLVARQSRLQALIAAGSSDVDIVQEFYQRAFGRSPSRDELDRWCQRLAEGPDQERPERLEDFVWSLLNSRQFVENY